MKDKYRIGIIGCGYWGPNLLRNFAAHSNVSMSWVCDRNQSNLDKASNIYPSIVGIKAIDDNTLSKIDALVIATQAGTHFELAKMAIEKGINVFLEKPPCSLVKEAEELERLAVAHGVRVMVNHTYLYTAEYRAVKKLIADGELGRVRNFYSTRADFGLFQKDVNIVLHLMYHDIYMLLDLLGDDEVVDVRAGGKGFMLPGVEDIASAYLETASGALATINTNMLFPIKKRDIVISGDQAILLWDDTSADKLRLYGKTASFDKDKGCFNYQDSGDIRHIEVGNEEALKTCAAAFIDYLDDIRTPSSTLGAGIKVMKVLERIQKALAS